MFNFTKKVQIITLISAIAALIGSWWTIIEGIDRTGVWVKEKIRQQVAEEIKKIDTTHKQVELFKEKYLPFLEKSMRYRPVGIYRDEEDGSIKYRHIDGKLYMPKYWEEKRAYFFRKENDDWEMCH